MDSTQNAQLTKVELLRSLEATLGHCFNTNPVCPSPNPLIIVISGPSGVGKDAVIKRLRESRDSLHFVRDELLEYALVYGDYKGIPKKQIREYMGKGCDIVLRVDIQGAETLRRILGKSAVFVFLVAESELALVERLVERRTESREELLVRIATAREEVKHVRNFDYVVVNAKGQLDNAVKLVESIIDAEKAKVRQRNAVI
ncbi:hypothetical protein JRO89_XS03G0194900 [Xanthoceras sorbifolium]|uniref:Guanylate kinase-like domain-containing protein n=1 Tax=Xanthoceras sorbifolium TaxID=99658 RepID=A0ABQ8IAL2_9ROSI|nr:hypothetical protein JRO89_XS03G0194900 [Xanthoceras sorbifolium]